jgi:hypothetical protein
MRRKGGFTPPDHEEQRNVNFAPGRPYLWHGVTWASGAPTLLLADTSGRRPWSAAGPPAAGAEGLRPGARDKGPGTVSRISRPFSRVRQPVAVPHRQLICLLIRLPADSGAPFQRRTCRTWRE